MLVFKTNSGTVHGREFWATDGTPSGMVLPGFIPSWRLADDSFAKINRRLFFCPGDFYGRYC